jgi:hypothetical protein
MCMEPYARFPHVIAKALALYPFNWSYNGRPHCAIKQQPRTPLNDKVEDGHPASPHTLRSRVKKLQQRPSNPYLP